MTDFQHWPNLFHIGSLCLQCVYLIKMKLYETQLINLAKNKKKLPTSTQDGTRNHFYTKEVLLMVLY